jgi:glycosyltransferase involved in cell wall biosynthesis
LEAELRALVQELGLEETVMFTGMRTDVYRLLPGFDVFALSSRYEGLPIALLEAMATGVACVATRVGGIPEVVVHGREGLLVEPADPGVLAAALEKLVVDDPLRDALGHAARARASTFDLRRAVLDTQTIYERCLEGG